MTRACVQALVFCLAFAVSAAAQDPAPGCGDPNDDQSITATDALAALKAAVGLQSCDKVRCDVNNDGKVSATDALVVLKSAVGLTVALDCPGVAVTSITALPLATSPVAANGQDAQSSLTARSMAIAGDAGGTIGGAAGGAIPITAGDDFFKQLDDDAHFTPSVAACEMVNRFRNAVSWAAESDKLLCYVREILGNQVDTATDFYDGQPHVIELNVAQPGFCANTDQLTTCRTDEDCGQNGPCVVFDQQGKNNIKAKLKLVRASDATDATISEFELFSCEDTVSDSYSVSIKLDDTVDFSALQVDVDYSAIPGGFDGFGGEVKCTSPLTDSGALFVANDDEGIRTLSLGFVTLAAVQGPTTLATCSFTETGSGVKPSDFIVSVVDAADGTGDPIRPTASIESISGSDQGQVQTQYMHQTINGTAFSMVSKGVFGDASGTGKHSISVSAGLNDSGQFTGSKTINIASSFADAGFGFNGSSEETFIQEPDTIFMSGVEQGSLPGVNPGGDGTTSSGNEDHVNSVIGLAALADSNTDLDNYNVDLLGIGIGAAKTSMQGSSSFLPCTLETCGFDDSCDRLGLSENENGECTDKWQFAVVEGWNASAAVDEEAAVDFIGKVADADLPVQSGNEISFEDSESYDCSGDPELTIDVDMFPVIQACGDLNVDHDQHLACFDNAGGNEIDNCGGPDICSVSGAICADAAPCPLEEDTCVKTPPCEFNDPCAGPNPEKFCFDDPEAFDPCDTDSPPPFCNATPDGPFGNCCAVRPEPSCDFAEVTDCVCAQDDFCCNTEWDGPCVALANSCGAQCFDDTVDPCAGENPPFYCNGFGGDNTEPGDCCHATFGVPGCQDPEIQTSVCNEDDYCCNVEWDPPCVQVANAQGAGCFDESADPANGAFDPCLSEDPPPFCGKLEGVDECCLQHPAPGCVQPEIQQAVCNMDHFCCDVQWDGACVQHADEAGAECFDGPDGKGFEDPCQSDFPPPFCFDDFGDPCASENPPPFCVPTVTGSGECCTPTPREPGCSDPEVTKCVCQMDSFCCESEWDDTCVKEANSCGAGCVDPSTFDPCFSPDPPDSCGDDFDPCKTDFPPPFCSDPNAPSKGEQGNCCGPTFGVPGCEDEDVQACVCAKDDYCCNVEWDPPCVALAGTCGAGCFDDNHQDPCAGDNPAPWCAGGNFDPGKFDPCVSQNPPSWCGTAATDPCASADPPAFCDNQGDLDPCAVAEPPFFCTDTNYSGFGDCCVIHDATSCEVTEIAVCVCNQDDFCCNNEWDFSCIEEADACGAQCFDADHVNPCAGPQPAPWCEGDDCDPNIPGDCDGVCDPSIPGDCDGGNRGCDPTIPGDCDGVCDPSIPGDCDGGNRGCDPTIPGDCDGVCDPSIPGDCDGGNRGCDPTIPGDCDGICDPKVPGDCDGICDPKVPGDCDGADPFGGLR